MLLTTKPPEIFGVPVSSDTEDEIHDAAECAGWIKAGSGDFSTVFVKDRQALKIFDDAAYLDFLEQIVTPANEAFPMVLSGPFVGHGLSAVVLERLEPLAESDVGLGNAILDLAEESLCLYAGRLDAASVEAEDLRARIGADAIDALDLIVGLAHAFGLGIDLQPQNMMRRPETGQLVFTDPLKV